MYCVFIVKAKNWTFLAAENSNSPAGYTLAHSTASAHSFKVALYWRLPVNTRASSAAYMREVALAFRK